ncbi:MULTISPECIES: lipase family protein [Actinoplanes]|uniref:alpha/beta hydrolase n=1 Tax=Actinoplanes TaxID=1865 RepID=UPI0005F2EDAB|nr:MULTISPECIES: lipase family protein [Actinoplanes]GLY02672.1 lipase [Actinoplanes sp. NBRC 101535]
MSLKTLGAAIVGAVLLTGPIHAVASASTRGALIDVAPVAAMDTAQVKQYLTAFGLDTAAVRYGVDAKRILYRTVDPDGEPIEASALVVLPRSGDRAPRQVTWLHGTTAYRGSVASVADGNDRAAALFFATAGFLTTAPDYLGLGAGPGFHPYAHTPSTVTAAVDALRAARQLAVRSGLRPDPRVGVTGHSQGGLAAMALGAELQRRGDLGGLAPIAGPMRPSVLVADALDGRIANGVAYLAYWTVAWNRLYHWYDAPAEVFRDPSVPELFDGEHPHEEIFVNLPGTVGELFTPAWLERLRQPVPELLAADRYCDWRPGVPVTLYAASGDRDVPIANSAWCRDRLGGAARLIDLGPETDHAETPRLALPRILATFARG